MKIPLLVVLAAVAITGCERLTNPGKGSGGTTVSDASLKSLAVSSGTLTPTFSSTTTSYTVAVTNDVTTITVTPTATDANAFITVNGGSVASGATSPSLALPVGTTNIIVRVVSPDTTVNRNYTVAATRAP